MAPTAHPRWQDSPESSVPGPDSSVGPFPEDLWLHLRTAWRLSDRELKIIPEICANQELESIAGVLDLPSEVVYRTLQRIYVKLRIGGRRELKWRVRMEYSALVANQPGTGMPVGPIAA